MALTNTILAGDIGGTKTLLGYLHATITDQNRSS